MCEGQLVGLIPFEQALPDGEGRRIWHATAGGPARGRCPFCAGTMHSPDADADAAGLAVCRRCAQVWVPADAQAWLNAHTARVRDGSAAPSLGHPAECPVCGAPWSPDPGGQCRYCREQLVDDDRAVIAASMLAVSEGRASL